MTSSPPANFDSFAALRRGHAAPSWITESVTNAWRLEAATTDIQLIAVSENATFRIDVNGQPHSVLRLHRPGYVSDPAQIEGELLWLQAIKADTGVAVPEVIPRADGTLVHQLTSDVGEPWLAVLFTFIEGRILEDLMMSENVAATADMSGAAVYRRLGETTARLHDHATTWKPPAGFTRFSWRLHDMLGARSRWGDWRAAVTAQADLRLLERAEVAALQVISSLPVAGAGWGLVHADLRPSNIMLGTDAELTVIDFDDCGTSWLLWDFASSLTFIEHEDFAPELAASWVEGYTTVRSFTEADRTVACALSMVRRLQMLGWTTTHRQDALPPRLWAGQVPGTIEIALRYLDNQAWLFEPTPNRHQLV